MRISGRSATSAASTCHWLKFLVQSRPSKHIRLAPLCVRSGREGTILRPLFCLHSFSPSSISNPSQIHSHILDATTTFSSRSNLINQFLSCQALVLSVLETLAKAQATSAHSFQLQPSLQAKAAQTIKTWFSIPLHQPPQLKMSHHHS